MLMKMMLLKKLYHAKIYVLILLKVVKRKRKEIKNEEKMVQSIKIMITIKIKIKK